MNRRELIRRGPMAMLGILGIAAGVQSSPQTKREPVIISISVPMDENAVLEVVREDYKNGGRLRELIQSESRLR